MCLRMHFVRVQSRVTVCVCVFLCICKCSSEIVYLTRQFEERNFTFRRWPRAMFIPVSGPAFVSAYAEIGRRKVLENRIISSLLL